MNLIFSYDIFDATISESKGPSVVRRRSIVIDLGTSNSLPLDAFRNGNNVDRIVILLSPVEEGP